MKILLVQTSFLGDTILSTPVIAAIKSLYPNSELWMMTTKLAAELVSNNSDLAGIIVFDKRAKDRGLRGLLRLASQLRSIRFDRVYSLHKSYRTALLLFVAGIPERIGFSDAALSFLYHKTIQRDLSQHDVLRNLSILGAELADVRAHATLKISAAAKQYQNYQNYAVVAPGSVWLTKRWSVAGFRQVCSDLIKRGLNVVLVGDKNESQIASEVAEGLNVINLAAKTSISELVGLVSQAQLVVCNDSMVLHLASCFSRPTVAIFCATVPEFGFGPWNNPRARVVQVSNLACKPCAAHGGNRCPTGTLACINMVSASDVTEAIEQVLGS